MSTQTAPAASVVIAAYAGAGIIGEQLEALCAQKGAPSFEVLVVDNNSPDNLREVCLRFATRLDLRIVPATRHQGQGYARNVGVLAARGEVVLICDQDDVVSEAWVAGLVEAVGDGGVLATGLMDFKTLNDPVTEMIGWGLPLHGPFEVHGYLPFVFGSNLGIARNDFIAIGGMDNAFRGGDEDVDFSWRAQEAGLELVVSDAAVVHYRLRSTPKAVYRQQLGYGRTPVLSYIRSEGTARQLRGMSLKWTLAQVAKTPAFWLRTRKDPRTRLHFAQETGRLVGNLHGQWLYRVLKRVPAPFTLREMEQEGLEIG